MNWPEGNSPFGLTISEVFRQPRQASGLVADSSMMSRPVRSTSVYEQLLQVPEHLVAEIIHGALITQPRPAARRARAASKLGAELDGPFDRGRGGPGGWIILDEPELHLGNDVLVPDLAGWRRERMPELPDVKAFELPPDWVCEVLSPSTQATDRADKLPIYASHAVSYAWLVDPDAKTLEAFRLESGRWSLLGVSRGDVTARIEPFEAVVLDVAALWAR